MSDDSRSDAPDEPAGWLPRPAAPTQGGADAAHVSGTPVNGAPKNGELVDGELVNGAHFGGDQSSGDEELSWPVGFMILLILAALYLGWRLIQLLGRLVEFLA